MTALVNNRLDVDIKAFLKSAKAALQRLQTTLAKASSSSPTAALPSSGWRSCLQ